jgi:hypothetical protein
VVDNALSIIDESDAQQLLPNFGTRQWVGFAIKAFHPDNGTAATSVVVIW